MRSSPPHLLRLSAFSLLAVLLSGKANAEQAFFRQSSSPVGFVSEESVVVIGDSATTVVAPFAASSYVFAYWTVDGVRQSAPDGRSPFLVSATVLKDTEAVAVYVLRTADTDGDGILDWREEQSLGSLAYGRLSDPDSDGLMLSQEASRGDDFRTPDLITEGGIAWRDSASFVFVQAHTVTYTIRSSPVGFVDAVDGALDSGTSLSVAAPPPVGDGFIFTHWTVNQSSQLDEQGRALWSFDITLSEPSNIVAHYLPINQDSDGDGLLDWQEIRQFGGLTHSQNADPDGDGLSLAIEQDRGDEWLIQDSVTEGGVAWRDSAVVDIGGIDRIAYSFSSQPVGFVAESGSGEPGLVVTTPLFHGIINGYAFIHWEMNGVRQSQENGQSLQQVEIELSHDVDLVAFFISPSRDDDLDGLLDWKELYHFGSLSPSALDDHDQDGLALSQEIVRGDQPLIPDLVSKGGIAWRNSASVLLNLNPARIKVSLEPQEAISAGAAWSLDGGKSWMNSNDEVQGLLPGVLELRFKAVTGFKAPDSQTAVLEAGKLSIKKAAYVPVGPIDFDGDEMPDEWELTFGFDDADPTDAHADQDGDGASNLTEYITGTDPLDETNSFKAWIEGGDDELIFRMFPYNDSFTATVEYSFDMIEWIVLVPESVSLTEAVQSLTFSLESSKPSFFRVRLSRR